MEQQPDNDHHYRVNPEHKIAEDLHKRYHRLIYYFLRIFDLPEDQLDDLFNQVFVKILKGLTSIKHYRNLKSWVVTITKNEIYSYLNRRDREENVIAKNSDFRMIAERSSQYKSGLTPENEAIEKQLMSAFEEGVSQLDNNIAEPFLMRYRDAMRWKEISNALGIKEDTARKRAERARELIKRHLNRRLG